MTERVMFDTVNSSHQYCGGGHEGVKVDHAKDDQVETLFERIRQEPDGETSEYTGRAVAALATDHGVMRRTGAVYAVDALADAYGFTDIDGRTPRLYY